MIDSTLETRVFAGWHTRVAASVLLSIVAAGPGCSAVPASDAAVEIGDPLPGLDAAQRSRFEAGRALFGRVFRPEDGLGPLFNENQCSACHTDPASGGTGEQAASRATRFEPPDRCDLLPLEGGENVQANATPALRAHAITRRPMPAAATETDRFIVPFLFGLGLAEAIPEEAILALADPDDRDGDGISGRAGRDASGRFARFGRKAEHATIRSFVEGALLLEMGLTSPARPVESLLNGEPFPPGVDPAADPEVDSATVAALTDFVRFLAPPPRRIPDDAETQTLIRGGERLFETIGCAACHVPAMRTARSDVPALDRRTVRLYSDLLLHDMGQERAGACGIGASPTEYRTEPLAGLGHRRVFLHDGRTRDLFEALRLHGGESAAARDAFERLDRVTQETLIRFLRSL
jgi:CxxC motif-containing protein (DUF1111 family)